MIVYRCEKCDRSFLNGVELFRHLENNHPPVLVNDEKKCPECNNEKVVFLAKTFEMTKEKYHIYYCYLCKIAMKIEKS
jgi:DNA-directed RNA polymerase subunit M/transcription elongation factor TFIIS